MMQTVDAGWFRPPEADAADLLEYLVGKYFRLAGQQSSSNSIVASSDAEVFASRRRHRCSANNVIGEAGRGACWRISAQVGRLHRGSTGLIT